MSEYTDEDVRAAMDAARVDSDEEESLLDTLGISEDYMETVVIRMVLDAVAPAIAARALGEASDALEEFGGRDLPGWVTSWMLNRANEIANGRI